MASTITRASAARTHQITSPVRHAHELKRRAGRAYVMMPGSATDMAAAIGRHHTTITHRRAGQGGLAGVLIEVDAWERAGIDTSALTAALIETQLRARGRSASATLDDLITAQQRVDCDEDVEETAYLLHRDKAAGRRWLGRLIELSAHIDMLVPSLAAEVQP